MAIVRSIEAELGKGILQKPELKLSKGYENTLGKAWNGTFNNEAGKELPDGVYYYIFKQDPDAAALKGFVHIYR